MSRILKHAKSINGVITTPGDKSITHRALVMGALADGDTKISKFLRCADTISTISCLQKLGISIEDLGNNEVLVHGRGMHGLSAPSTVLNVGNSGTTTRLLTGILSAQNFVSEIRGDDSLNRRPMEMIIKPLTQMGACISGNGEHCCTPLHIDGSQLKGIRYEITVSPSQVKTSILFAGLFAKGPTELSESFFSRNHTEQIMRLFGADLMTDGTTIRLNPPESLAPQEIEIPGDLSSAAFLIAAALILPDSQLLLKNVGINETRLGFISAVQNMGGNITLQNATHGIEPCADILVKSSKLHGIVLEKDIIPSVIDELPIITVLCCFAEGRSEIRDAYDLRVKESDRIDAMSENLKRMGADITTLDDGMIIEGGKPLHGAIVGSRLDHRIAMSLAVAGVCAEGNTELIGSECVSVSYPQFYNDLESVCNR